ncbi:aminotransferase class I/II-fold pyridoxal phosphate-dependent enzyme [Sulfobacillus harzensis]|uniref:Aminotransferase n=1 Tax=Sulfobacillus harzensis TaxID=2729629 RepID=A0A7Y0L750_9FIRM|nr:aminotransferase class I/II-fold pyridoxal phosphate-dependent enzyme [Sulfobacillus harzensis]NMP24554.1 aminotransferase class I/II-fold pyridoxal phosphate-dependent enzyme [Sulfobacillus harzensis]
MQVPNYEGYGLYATLAKVKITPVPWYFDPDRFLQELDAVLKKAKPTLIVVTSPNGWTGAAITAETMRDIAKASYEHGHLLCIDQAYSAFGSESYTTLLTDFPNVIFIKSFSKSLGLAGFRVASVFCSPEVASYLKKFKPASTFSRLSGDFLIYCLQHPQRFSTLRRACLERRERLSNFVIRKCPTWTVHASNANFLFVDTHDANVLSGLSRLLRARRIIVRFFADERLGTHFRMTVPGDHEMHAVMECLELFGRFEYGRSAGFSE